MTKIVKASIINLTPETKAFLKIMNFPEIPEIAKHIAFFPDGDAQFFETLDRSMAGFAMPSFTMITYYKDITLAIPDED